MSSSQDNPQPVVEEKPGGDRPDVTVRALEQRIRQQGILADLGVAALQGASFEQLLSDTVQLTADGLNTEFCKILEHLPADNTLIVRAGIGWEPGIVGTAKVGADLASPAGFAIRTGKPVISNHLENEERFRTPEILQRHGIRRAMNVILQGDGRPFGVLEVDSRSEHEFEEHDIAFLQGAANILGMAIERERHERSLRAALTRDKSLLREMNHRVKNSLAIIASMLSLQARDAGNDELTKQLREASQRVTAVAKAHDQLSRSSQIERMDLGQYIRAICADLDESVAHCNVHTEAEDGIEVATDRAISIALIVNELIANAAKYAYRGTKGSIWVTARREGNDRFRLTVRDQGAGLPPDFDMQRPKGLGMRIVASFVRQLGAEQEVRTTTSGTEFIVTVPLAAPQ